MDDDLFYLQPDFQPTSFKVAELRGVLNKHNISFTSGAKKADLVELFNTQLRPQARKLLNAQRKVARTSRGIEDAASSTATTQVEEEDDVKPAPSTKKPRGRPKKSEKAAEEETDATAVAPARPKSRSRVDKSRERTKSIPRSAAKTPVAKTREEVPENWQKYGEDSPFTADNPFQSGGSSPPQPVTVSRRRKTDGPVSEKRESTGRRKTDNPQVVRQSKKTYQVPVSAIGNDENEVEVGEEFEESELAELEEERRSGKVAVVPVRRTAKSKSKTPSSSGAVSRIVNFTLGAIAIGVLGAYRQEKVQVGYCGVGEQSEWLSKLNLPEWAQTHVLPSCEPCPPHATCYSDLRTECDKGFVVSNNPLSLGGLVPIAPSCEPDGETPKRVQAMTNRILKGLNIQNAKAECGGTDSQGSPITTPEISEKQIRESIHSAKRKDMSDEEFDELFDTSISEITRHEDITVTERDEQRYFRSSSTDQFPFQCSLRKSLVRTVGQYFRYIVIVSMVLIVSYWTFLRTQSWIQLRSDAQKYASRVFSALAAQSSAEEGYVSISRLRDDVLRDEFSSARRQRVWGAVEELVEQNVNVRSKVGQTNSGDVGKGWRWIGAGDGQSPSNRLEVKRYDMEEMKTPEVTEIKRWMDHEEPKF